MLKVSSPPFPAQRTYKSAALGETHGRDPWQTDTYISARVTLNSVSSQNKYLVRVFDFEIQNNLDQNENVYNQDDGILDENLNLNIHQQV